MSSGQLQETKPHKQEVGKLPIIKKCYEPESQQAETSERTDLQEQKIISEEIIPSENQALKDLLSALDSFEPQERPEETRHPFLLALFFFIVGFLVILLFKN